MIGDPIAHSLSPVIHGYWLETYGLEGSYDRVRVARDELSEFIGDMGAKGFAGMNVTIPHKEAVAGLVDRLDDSARGLGAVNTVWFENDQLVGGNSDVYGFLANLDQAAPGWSDTVHSVWILGAGGAARGVAFGLQERGLKSITLTNRSPEKADRIVSEFLGEGEVIAWDSRSPVSDRPMLVVNTTSLGMTGHDPLTLSLDKVPDGSVVCDIVYNPLETDLLFAARERGLIAVDGLGMLLHQAALGFEKWFGVKPEVTSDQRRIVLKALGQ